MAPEQASAESEAIDERTDVFALGGILYNILSSLQHSVADFPTEAR